MKPLEPSSRAAAAPGPKTAMPAARRRSARPATKGPSGPTTTKSTVCASANATGSGASTHVATCAMPGLPGAAYSAVQRGEAARARAKACSRPPEPMRRMRMGRDTTRPRAGRARPLTAYTITPGAPRFLGLCRAKLGINPCGERVHLAPQVWVQNLNQERYLGARPSIKSAQCFL